MSDDEAKGIFIALALAAIFFIWSCADAIDKWGERDIHQPKAQEVRK